MHEWRGLYQIECKETQIASHIQVEAKKCVCVCACMRKRVVERAGEETCEASSSIRDHTKASQDCVRTV